MKRILVDLVTLTFNQTPRVELFFWAFFQPRNHDSWWESTQPMDPAGIQPDSNAGDTDPSCATTSMPCRADRGIQGAMDDEIRMVDLQKA